MTQAGISAALPTRGRYLFFSAKPEGDPGQALARLADSTWTDDRVVGLGAGLVKALGGAVPHHRAFPSDFSGKVDVPSTQTSLFLWLRGSDPGELLHLGREVEDLLAAGFELDEVVDAFRFKEGRDLTGYVDGTENPAPERVPEVTFVAGGGDGISGGSFASVQRWEHDLDTFSRWPQEKKDHAIGRRLSDNVELDDAPETAHVKRTAQESFSPEAFLLRRSMPYTHGEKQGLLFVSFACALDAFEAQLRRMVGGEDEQVDALFGFSKPVTGSHFFCPPVRDGRLDLRAILGA